ncbi:UNVERIFIED_CONTAM: hypothetical protein K2H54_037804 [Gekko kuhli]
MAFYGLWQWSAAQASHMHFRVKFCVTSFFSVSKTVNAGECGTASKRRLPSLSYIISHYSVTLSELFLVEECCNHSTLLGINLNWYFFNSLLPLFFPCQIIFLVQHLCVF